MKRLIIAVVAATALISGCARTSPQDALTKHDKEIDAIIAQMSLEEKVMMLHSKTIMSSEGGPRL